MSEALQNSFSGRLMGVVLVMFLRSVFLGQNKMCNGLVSSSVNCGTLLNVGWWIDISLAEIVQYCLDLLPRRIVQCCSRKRSIS